jgi:hypothetical protein
MAFEVFFGLLGASAELKGDVAVLLLGALGGDRGSPRG